MLEIKEILYANQELVYISDHIVYLEEVFSAVNKNI